MNIVLLFPPQWEPGQPPLGLAALAGALRLAGHIVHPFDCNVESYRYFLTARRVGAKIRKIAARCRELEAQPARSAVENEELAYVREVLAASDDVIADLEAAKAVFRHPADYYDHELHNWSRGVVTSALDIVSFDAPTDHLALTGYWSSFAADSAEELLPGAKHGTVFTRFFSHEVVPAVQSISPSLIGISVISDTQVLPAFQLARLIKKKLPAAHINMGGSVVSQWWPVLEAAPSLFSWVDSFIAYEGETAMVRLADALSGAGGWSDVPNLAYLDRKTGGVVKNRLGGEAPDLLPPPDFQGFPLEKYFAPELVMPVAIGRGCYWSKCAFCDHPGLSRHDGRRYNARSIDRTIADLVQLSRQWGARHFFFVDEAIPPSTLQALAERVLESGLRIEWICYARFEPALTGELCRKLAAAGCRKIFMGAESGSQRILDMVDKGNDASRRKEILANLSAAGIAVHLFCMVGFPTETRADIARTREFIVRSLAESDQFGFTFDIFPFSLKRSSRMYHQPERFGITRIIPDPDRELQFSFDYEGFAGNAAERAERLAEEIGRHFPEHSLGALQPAQDSGHLLFISKRREKEGQG